MRDLQSRLRQIAWYFGNVTDDYGPSTTAAVKGFQEKREIAVTGYVDQRTLDRLDGMTRDTHRRRARQPAPRGHQPRAARPALHDGRAMCVDKTSSTVRWVVDGRVQRTMAVRFGSSYTPTREGLFHVGWKSRDHVSKLYDSPMPFAMFFSGGQAVHYSSDFAAHGLRRRVPRVRERPRPRRHPVALRPGGGSATRSSSTGPEDPRAGLAR